MVERLVCSVLVIACAQAEGCKGDVEAVGPDIGEILLPDSFSFSGWGDAAEGGGSAGSDQMARADDAGLDQPGPEWLLDLSGGADETTDLAVLSDSPELADGDSVPDAQVVDAGPCGYCPSDKPMCADGLCVCTGKSCPEGKHCKGGDCIPCTDDLHCGPDCLSCASQGQYCNIEGTACVGCDGKHPCPEGMACIDGACTGCQSLGLCGPACLKCSGETPDCSGGQCVCNPSSCGPSSTCEVGTCIACTGGDPAHCGPSCLTCSGETPHCKGGLCVLCNSAKSCGPECAACPPGKPLCVAGGGPCAECIEDAHCPNGHHCSGNACVPDCQASGCVTDLSAGGEKCSSAFVVGRQDAAKTAKFSGDTYSDENDDDLNYFFEKSECWDASYDNFYRIFLMPGEKLSVTATPDDLYFDLMLKIYTGTECDDDKAGWFDKNDKYLLGCYNSGWDDEPESFQYSAAAQGWYTVVVDGRQVGPEEEDWGAYEIQITLTCTQSNCCCP